MSRSDFQGAHDFSMIGPQFIDNSQVINNSQIHPQTTVHYQTADTRTGLRTLLDASIPAAFHDSSARDPPPRCHPGTRCDYIDTITKWCLSDEQRLGRNLFWMKGPAGVGKSAVAQSCAEALGDRLGATFFFSEFNHRQDPNCLFTSISYQLAVKFKSFGDIVDRRIHHDPTLVDKAPRHQFQDLIVTPLNELRAQGELVEELVVIVDGLDECAGSEAQSNIVNIVAASTCLLWVFFSRPESHIVATFTSPELSPISYHMELPVSRDIDNEIAKYLTDELEKVRREHDLPKSWPSERAIGTLVELSAGLFIYAVTVVRFVSDHDSPGPDDQLRSVLELATRYSPKDKSSHPLSALDIFYTLIMRRVPPKIRLTARRILLATTFSTSLLSTAVARPWEISNMLDLSELQFRNACRSLCSVVKSDDDHIQFYHASFMEFLRDPARSGDFCIMSKDCAATLRSKLLEKLNRIHAKSHSEGFKDIPMTWPQPTNSGSQQYTYLYTIQAFFNLCQSIPLDTQMLEALAKFNYAATSSLTKLVWFDKDNLDPELLFQIVPGKFRRKIVYRSRLLILFRSGLLGKPRKDIVWNRLHVLGQGKNKALCWEVEVGGRTRSCLDVYPKLSIDYWRKSRLGHL